MVHKLSFKTVSEWASKAPNNAASSLFVGYMRRLAQAPQVPQAPQAPQVPLPQESQIGTELVALREAVPLLREYLAMRQVLASLPPPTQVPLLSLQAPQAPLLLEDVPQEPQESLVPLREIHLVKNGYLSHEDLKKLGQLVSDRYNKVHRKHPDRCDSENIYPKEAIPMIQSVWREMKGTRPKAQASIMTFLKV